MKKLHKDDTILIEGRRWFDRINGNTYHSATVYVNNEIIGREPFEYGYGDQYKQTGYALLSKAYGLKIDSWRDLDGYNVRTTVSDGLKRDL
jgi:hypothetical protein